MTGSQTSLAGVVTEQLAAASRIVEDGHGMTPAWRIATPEGSFLILTHFENGKPEQRDRIMYLLSRFLLWKMATSFVLTAETYLGLDDAQASDKALLAVAVSYHERLAAIQRLQTRDGAIDVGPIEWLDATQVDEAYWRLLPRGSAELTAEEVAELSAIFGADGELAAHRLA